ncbi:MAG TPA: trypsin-like peptidase domain-containing protein [Pilimelia sp.]|nr:trypsin-like peptidase domain-containing protein [Pilimelia sp.]
MTENDDSPQRPRDAAPAGPAPAAPGAWSAPQPPPAPAWAGGYRSAEGPAPAYPPPVSGPPAPGPRAPGAPAPQVSGPPAAAGPGAPAAGPAVGAAPPAGPAAGGMPPPASGPPHPDAAPPASGPPHGYPWAPPPASGPPHPDTAPPASGPPHGYPWAPPPAPPGPPPATGGGRAVALGAAAVLLAVTSGLLGGWVATRLDDDPAATAARGPASAAPVLERSSLAGIADAVQPSVVSISTGSGEGSGVIRTEDGFIVTNNHVVASAGGDRVDVVFANGKTARATVVGTDPRTDLAVVKAEGVSGLRAATFGDSTAMQVGDTVLALGSPLGLQGSVTAGIVSALNRTIRPGGQGTGPASLSGLLQTDAPINPGNSGGALVNTRGEVIGINTAIATPGQGQGNIGLGFAIPSNKAVQVADQLIKGEKVSHPYVGVQVADAEGGGALISRVEPGSPADRVGLQAGDVVIRLGGTEINDADDLVSAVQTGKVGDRLELTFMRNGERRTTTVTLGEAS